MLLLQQKSFTGVQGLELDGRMRMIIAAQACLPVLALGLDYYHDWVEIVVYPGGMCIRNPGRFVSGSI